MSNVRTAIIPIAGLGSRLYPATKAIPKAFFPVVDEDGFMKPLLHLLVAEALSAGVERVVIVAHPDHRARIAQYFNEPVPSPLRGKPELASVLAEIETMRSRTVITAQESPEGFGHAVLCARDYVRTGPVLVIVGDHIFRVAEGRPSCAAQAVEFFDTYQRSIVGVERVDASWVDALAIIQGDPLDDEGRAFRVEYLKEKPGIEEAQRRFRVPSLPPDTWLGTIGIDVLTPPIFEILDYNYRNDIRSRGEIQLRDAMETLVLLEGMVAGVLEGERLDVGTAEMWLATTTRLALDSPHGESVRRALDNAASS